jgi:hypothetical protein
MSQRPDNHVPRTRPQLAERIIDGEALIVNADRGEIVVLNETGAFIWPLLDGRRDLAQITAAVCERFDIDAATARADVEAFLDALEARGALAS